MTPDTVCMIASMTKAVTGTAAMQLVEQGVLDLDAPAAKWAPYLGEVQVLAIGAIERVDAFMHDLVGRAPPLSSPTIAEVQSVPAAIVDSFKIIDSEASADAQIFVPPDYFMCEDCKRELQDPSDRRHAYPFINCTQCGPRYTLRVQKTVVIFSIVQPVVFPAA